MFGSHPYFNPKYQRQASLSIGVKVSTHQGDETDNHLNFRDTSALRDFSRAVKTIPRY